MSATGAHILTDSFGRKHTYLRISLTEKCNLRCTYCMPQEGVPLTPSKHLMSAEEIFQMASLFVQEGVTKIRLTGGEPLVRKDFPELLQKLSSLPIKCTLTTNGVIIDRHLDLLKECEVTTINLSLDTLSADKFKKITFRNDFEKVYENLMLLLDHGFQVKINVVLMKGVNDDEIIDFLEFTKENPISVRFIEFMPFEGNAWNRTKTISYQHIMSVVKTHFGSETVLRLQDAPNDTTKNYKIRGFEGFFGIISTVTNPFCDSCNRLRLTANGQLKNCLFSDSESDLLTPFRAGEDIRPVIHNAVMKKHAMRGGLNRPEDFEDVTQHKNRSMIRIGG
ncbi:GTP 3',8-cyclase MoaA [Altibacter sp. HG106]|uniref:GTP 3',8-cyclase MoaA n=1 Tax=Altibacter sp. HG106 TaxID=3023937 RepID=UPI00234FECCC|nr:GTP 3',8-cyclase MoaA [Altibacter sp. HG106]MDC7995337.1 GTP 3',8-cyclase MoaA [Altibacter sp. HG106]